MKDAIISTKAKKEEILPEGIADTTAPAEVARVSSPVDLAERYIWAICNADLDAAKELGLTGIRKYWRCIGQVVMELDWLYDCVPVLATFVRYSHRVYNNEEVGQNMSVRRDINPE